MVVGAHRSIIAGGVFRGVIQFAWLGTSWPVGMIAAGRGPLGRGSVCVGARHPRYDMLEVYSMVWSSWVWLSCVAQKVDHGDCSA